MKNSAIKKIGFLLSFAITLVAGFGLLFSKATNVHAAGDSENDPLVVSTYESLENAIKGTKQYIKIVGLNEDYNVSGEGLTAIQINRKVNVIIEGANKLTDLSLSGNKHLNALFYVNSGGELNLSGEGTLLFKPSLTNGMNAVICNNGGDLNVNGGTYEGSFNGETYSRAIYQLSGTTVINDGTFIGATTNNNQDNINAVTFIGGNFNIKGGTFTVNKEGKRTNDTYALGIRTEANGMMSAGLFAGITAGKTFNNYMVMNGGLFNGGSEINVSAISESNDNIECCYKINDANLRVKAPSTGVGANSYVEGMPMGATVSSVKWYNGSNAFAGNFTEGVKYTVKVTLQAKQFYRFAKGNTSATINNQFANVEVANDGKTVVVSYEFDATRKIISGFEGTLKSSSATADVLMTGDEMMFYDVNTGVVGLNAVVTSYHNCASIQDANDSNKLSGFFVEGNEYVLLIRLTAVSGYSFANDFSGTINGVPCELKQNISSETQVWGVKLTCAGTGFVTLTYHSDEGLIPNKPYDNIPVGEYILESNDDIKLTGPSYHIFKCWLVNGIEKNPGETIVVTSNMTIDSVWAPYVQGINITIPKIEAGDSPENVVLTVVGENYGAEIVWGVIEGEIPAGESTVQIRFYTKNGYVFKSNAVTGEMDGLFDNCRINGKMLYDGSLPMVSSPTEAYLDYTIDAVVTKADVTFYPGENSTGSEKTIRYTLGNIFLPQFKELDIMPENGYEYAGYRIGSSETLYQPDDIYNLTEDTSIFVVFKVEEHVHHLSEVTGVSATCTAQGSKTYYICDGCSKYFEDAEGLVEIEDLLAWEAIAPLGHVMENYIEEVPATDKTNGTLGHYHCTRCDKDVDSNGNILVDLTIPMTSCTHEIIKKVEKVEPTKTEYGVKEYYVCENCGKKFSDELGNNEIENFNNWIQEEGRIDKLPEDNPGENPGDNPGENPGDNPGENPENPNNPEPPKKEDEGDKKGGLNGGAIAGIAVGSVVLLAVIAYFAIGFTVYKKGKLAGKFFETIYKWIK